MKRLGLSVPKECPLAPPAFIPAVGRRARHRIPRGPQGISPKCCLSWNTVRPASAWKPNAAWLAGLDGGCQVPIAGHAEMLDDGTFELEGLVGEVDGSVIIRRKVTAAPMKPAPWASLWPVPRRGRRGRDPRPGVRAVSFPPPGCSGCRSLALTSRLAPQGKPIPFETGRVLFKAKTFGRGGAWGGKGQSFFRKVFSPLPAVFLIHI